jgi:hypothetical protein
VALRRGICAGLGLLVVVAVGEGASVWASSSPLRPVAPTAGVACGVERWPVKILADPMASQVKLTPHPSSVRALRRLRVPPSLPQRARNRPVETSTYRVRARLVESRPEDDSDFPPGDRRPADGRDDDRRVPRRLLHADRETGVTPADAVGSLGVHPRLLPLAERSQAAPRDGDDHRCWLLRLLARPVRCRAERDRAAPGARLLRDMPQRFPSAVERTVERTQANANPCHPCHGFHVYGGLPSTPATASADSTRLMCSSPETALPFSRTTTTLNAATGRWNPLSVNSPTASASTSSSTSA